MRYSLSFPTHGAGGAPMRGWVDWLLGRPGYRLDAECQALAARAIQEVCLDRGWRLVSIRTGEIEVAVVVDGEIQPERMIHEFKLAASRALVLVDGGGPSRKRFDRRARIEAVQVNEHGRGAAAG